MFRLLPARTRPVQLLELRQPRRQLPRGAGSERMPGVSRALAHLVERPTGAQRQLGPTRCARRHFQEVGVSVRRGLFPRAWNSRTTVYSMSYWRYLSRKASAADSRGRLHVIGTKRHSISRETDIIHHKVQSQRGLRRRPGIALRIWVRRILVR
jgi:hypothetical protein